MIQHRAMSIFRKFVLFTCCMLWFINNTHAQIKNSAYDSIQIFAYDFSAFTTIPVGVEFLISQKKYLIHSISNPEEIAYFKKISDSIENKLFCDTYIDARFVVLCFANQDTSIFAVSKYMHLLYSNHIYLMPVSFCEWMIEKFQSPNETSRLQFLPSCTMLSYFHGLVSLVKLDYEILKQLIAEKNDARILEFLSCYEHRTIKEFKGSFWLLISDFSVFKLLVSLMTEEEITYLRKLEFGSADECSIQEETLEFISPCFLGFNDVLNNWKK
jgi:hypothetical protein